MRQLIKIFKYRKTAIKIYDIGGYFKYEYAFKQHRKLVRDRSSSSTIKGCLKNAKDDYDIEEDYCYENKFYSRSK